MSEIAFLEQPERQQQTAVAPPAFGGKYLSITSFKRDRSGVATPVWFVQDDGRLLVQTDATSGKVKRIRRNPHVLVAPCTASGRLLADPVPARAELLGDAGAEPAVHARRATAAVSRRWRAQAPGAG